MSQSLELPDEVFLALRKIAAAEGQTPADWVTAQVQQATPSSTQSQEAAPLAERFAGRVGRIASGSREALSQDTGRKFAEHLEEKRKAGRL